jgi:hypothetical protein
MDKKANHVHAVAMGSKELLLVAGPLTFVPIAR